MELTDKQIADLNAPLDGSRVGQTRNGKSHMEAWDVRRSMNAIFGYAGWSAVVDEMVMCSEDHHVKIPRQNQQPDPNVMAWTVGYRARCTVTILATGATYSEWACGDAQNFPDSSRNDAHDFAVKTAESQAFKRAAMNLGNQFGLSLYKDGALDTEDRQSEPPADSPEEETGPWLTQMREAMEAGDVETLVVIKAEMEKAKATELISAGRTLAKWMDAAVIRAGQVKQGKANVEHVQAELGATEVAE